MQFQTYGPFPYTVRGILSVLGVHNGPLWAFTYRASNTAGLLAGVFFTNLDEVHVP